MTTAPSPLTERERRLVTAAQRVVENIPAERIETMRGLRRELPHSGGSHFITHARMLDFIDALAAYHWSPS